MSLDLTSLPISFRRFFLASGAVVCAGVLALAGTGHGAMADPALPTIDIVTEDYPPFEIAEPPDGLPGLMSRWQPKRSGGLDTVSTSAFCRGSGP